MKSSSPKLAGGEITFLPWLLSPVSPPGPEGFLLLSVGLVCRRSSRKNAAQIGSQEADSEDGAGMQTSLDHRGLPGQRAVSLETSYNLGLQFGSALACYKPQKVSS